jgi:hypothetical protein
MHRTSAAHEARRLPPMAFIPSINESILEWSRRAATTPPTCPSRSRSFNGIENVDDLNRITLAATCEVLPLFRDRDVTLLVSLASETMHIRVESRLVERALFTILEAASCCAQLDQGCGRVRVETYRQGEQAIIRTTAYDGELAIPATIPEILLVRARALIEAFRGAVTIDQRPGQTCFFASLPIFNPGAGELARHVTLSAGSTQRDKAGTLETDIESDDAGENNEWSRISCPGSPTRAAQRPIAPGA